jgi:hypothetical protein
MRSLEEEAELGRRQDEREWRGGMEEELSSPTSSFPFPLKTSLSPLAARVDNTDSEPSLLRTLSSNLSTRSDSWRRREGVKEIEQAQLTHA